jgi:hypothetical protein
METLSKHPERSIFTSSSCRSEAKAIYRLLNNDHFDLGEVLQAHKAATTKRVREYGHRVILAVQDTTGVNYSGHKKTENLGYFCDKSLGINVHTCLAVTIDGVVLGVLDQSYITRQEKDEAGNESVARENQK